eukprot:SM000081S22672  [mRNA]  locus=s81:444749:449655:- [translate_table: standard]
MVLVAAVREYVSRMLAEVPGMKVLLVDDDTVRRNGDPLARATVAARQAAAIIPLAHCMDGRRCLSHRAHCHRRPPPFIPPQLGIVSLALSQSDILHKEVFLVEPVGDAAASREPQRHLRAVAFLRPSPENVDHLRRHLRRPRFGEYHLFFSNILLGTHIQILADADESEAEFYGDYFALDPYHFVVGGAGLQRPFLAPEPDTQHAVQLCRLAIDGLASVFLSLKRRPLIRYQRGSAIAQRVAHEAAKLMYEQESGLFDFRRTDISPLLLILDRRDDPVTPLLNQWTYQAMLHELIGIHNNRVSLRHLPKVPKDQEDAFFRANAYENFGDLGANIKKMVDEFQGAARSNQNIHTIEDMAQFVENYPEYRKQHGTVSKHVTLMAELSRIVDERQLMSVSQVEQDLACNANQAAAFEVINELLGNERVLDIDRLRLVMLYALRYEKESPRQIEQLVTRLTQKPSKYKPGLVYTLLRLCGAEHRTGDLYGNRDLFNRAKNMARGLKGVDNVYTQHQPLLSQTIESLVRGRLRDTDYPFVGDHFQQARPAEVVIFIVGGTTYEEARAVALHNASGAGTRILLGGTGVLNSSSFLADLVELHEVDGRGLQ